MQKTALIWDLDGTLLDSYAVIVSSLVTTMAHFGEAARPNDILPFVIERSVNDYLHAAGERLHLPFDALKAHYSATNDARGLEIPLMPHAQELLAQTAEAGVLHFVYTHKGKSTQKVIENLQIADFFTEIVTSLNGFPRKPAPDAIAYLMARHGLSPARTFYVGDRSIDVDCAANAGVRSILYLPPSSPGAATGRESFVVRDLLDIAAIVKEDAP